MVKLFLSLGIYKKNCGKTMPYISGSQPFMNVTLIILI